MNLGYFILPFLFIIRMMTQNCEIIIVITIIIIENNYINIITDA